MKDTDTDWLDLWRELITRQFPPRMDALVDKYKAKASEGRERPDPLLDFVLTEMNGAATAIDIGPGPGRWTIPLAKRMRRVTAVEPTSSMADMLRQNLGNAGLDNVDILPGTWEETTPAVHDITVCAHGMYGSPDLACFVGKMERSSRQRCYLAIRQPPSVGILAELCLKIHGSPHDSANAVIAQNALLSMGIDVHVMVEEGVVPWVNATVEDAFHRAKKHLCLTDSVTVHDDLIRSTLEHRLTFDHGLYFWPDGMRSALLWWNVRQ